MNKYTIHYPSGKQFKIEGDFKICIIKGCQIPAIRNGERDILLPDPRAIIYAENKKVYNPRNFISTLPSEIREWLERNPNWDLIHG